MFPWVSFAPFVFFFIVLMFALRSARPQETNGGEACVRRRKCGMNAALIVAMIAATGMGGLLVHRSSSPLRVTMSSHSSSSSSSQKRRLVTSPPQGPVIPPAPSAPAPPEAHMTIVNGELRAKNTTIGIRASATQTSAPADTGGAEKPWVHGWINYVNTTGFHGLVAESSGTSPSQDDARREAIESAVSQLRDLLVTRRDVLAAKNFRNDDGALREVIANAVRDGETVADEYASADTRSYGTIWKHYLLIDTSPDTINPLADRFIQLSEAQKGRQLNAAGSLAALSGVIVLTYLFLNAATKGYFVWRLRATAILIVIVAVLVVLVRV